jgi:hypothetical protein
MSWGGLRKAAALGVSVGAPAGDGPSPMDHPASIRQGTPRRRRARTSRSPWRGPLEDGPRATEPRGAGNRVAAGTADLWRLVMSMRVILPAGINAYVSGRASSGTSTSSARGVPRVESLKVRMFPSRFTRTPPSRMGSGVL